MSSKQTSLKVAVLVVPPIQLLDMSPVDLFFMMSKSYLRDCQLPQAIVDRGIDHVEIYYVADEQSCVAIQNADQSSTTTTAISTGTAAAAATAKTTLLAGTTACLSIHITHTLTSPAVAPGNVDIVLVPGPEPSIVVSEAVKQFLRKHAKISSTHILSICTGIFVLAQAGILDGKTCTGPRPLIGMRLKKEYPHAKWIERRWTADATGRLWTAGGITNGQDMVASYIKLHFSGELADLVCTFAEIGDRDQDYDSSNVAGGLGFVWILARSFFKGIAGFGVKGGRPVSGQGTGPKQIAEANTR